MKTIINTNQIDNACIKVSCSDDQGTGFFITSNLILTAYHVVMTNLEDSSIIAKTIQGDIKCSVKDYDEELDICLLLSERDIDSYLPLLSSLPKVNEKCETYGYPHKSLFTYMNFVGRLNQILINDISDFVISDLNIDKNFDYEGMSGSPVIVNGKVIGMVRRQIDDRISAISFNKLRKFLEKNELHFEKEYDYQNIPSEFKEDVETSTPNYVVFEQIDEILDSNNNWYLLQGSPGSGKSTLVASYKPQKDSFVICCRYFIKVPNDSIPFSIRASKNTLLETLENTISKIITGYPIPKDEQSIEKRVQRLTFLLDELNDYYKDRNQIGLIFIDGLDEVKQIDDFLGILPIILPSNIKVILSCTSIEILSIDYKNTIEDDQIVNVTPIDLGQCEAFIIKEIGRDKLPTDIVQQIATKSEGHPLYLRYLVNFIKTQELGDKNKEIEIWLKEIPAIGGDISKYYNSIWDKIYSIPEKVWIIIILSQIRQAIKKEELYNILPSNSQLAFNSYYPSIAYLLKGGVKIEIYHNSFKEYISSKTKENVKQANDYISVFCEKNQDCSFSFNNLLFHYSISNTPEKSVDKCNQEWADKCAIMDVAPDLVLSDIKRVVSIAIDLCKTTEVIRLLLLLQRIEFRYDSVFADNANLIAQALISIGKYEASLKYLVRDNALLVDNEDAIMFLQLYYENGAFQEAEILQDAISSRYRILIDEGTKSKEGLDLRVFIMQLKAFSLSMNSNIKDGYEKFMNLLGALSSIQNKSKDKDDLNSYNAIYSIREIGASWHSAYAMGRFGIHASSTELSKITKIKLDNKWPRMRALQAIQFREINSYNTGVFVKEDNYYSLLEDIEFLIRNYGYTESKNELFILILALIDDNKNVKLVTSLIDKYLQYESEFNLRKENGVDLNYQDIHNRYFEFKCKGYVDSTNIYPIIEKNYLRYRNWEDYVISLINYLAFVEGKLYRLTAENNELEIGNVKKKLREAIFKIDFSFDERSFWERSYHLPEHIFPFIYSKAFEAIIEFDSDCIEEIINWIKEKSKIQLGLYSEGFRSSLCDICRTLIKYKYRYSAISELINLWEQHTLEGVQNRWERTPELLKIVELYGLIDDTEKANHVFFEMLKTSMGPSWYKEDQLDLLNTALSLKSNEYAVDDYLIKVASILDYASGEMTFQRYVRHAKESYVGGLVDHSRLNKAIEYIKFEVLPSPKQIIDNAESNIIDAPRIGDGYCLGARNINEQSAILELLDHSNIKSPFLKWALCETFAVNDDIFRYAQRFASHQGSLLKYFENEKSVHLDELYKVITEIASDRMMKEDLNDYLNDLGRNISETNKQKLQGYLLLKNIKWNLHDENNQFESKYEKERQPNKFDEFNGNSNLFNGQAIKRKELIEEAIRAFSSERISIWFGNYSTSSDVAKENLKSLFLTDKETLYHLKKLVEKYDNNIWVIASKLIWFLEDKLSDLQIKEIYDYISEHFEYLIRPPKSAFDKYSWLKDKNIQYSIDKELCKLLIWLLNSPSFLINQRAYNSILRLCKFEPDLIIPLLFNEALTEKSEISVEKSSLILNEFSTTHSELIIKLFHDEKLKTDDLTGIKHFTVKKNILDLSINLNKSGFSSLYQVIKNSIPENIILVGEVALDEPYLDSLIFEIEKLNSMGILNREFCTTFLNKIKEYCLPLSISEYIRSDKYLKRSFPEETSNLVRFDNIVRCALNVAILPRISHSNIDKVYLILNS